jgi:cold-inducible RNA-binding protein
LPAWPAAILALPRNREFLALHTVFLRSLVVSKKLYVGNLSYEVTNASLEELFAPFGSVRSAQVIQDRDTGRSKGFGFVEMADDSAALAAIQGLNEKEHNGRPLAVNEARPREDRPRGGGGGGGRGGRGGRGGGYGRY